MARSYSADYWRILHQRIAPSVVQLSIFNERNIKEPAHLGTGLVLCCTSSYIGIITTVSCDPADGYTVVARFANETELEAEVVLKSTLLFGLVIHGHNLQAMPCRAASFYEANPLKAGPVWAIGCFGNSLEQIIVPGQICACNFMKNVRGQAVKTFIHTCPIGDGLMGAPIIDQKGKILGMNITRTPETSAINFALIFEQLRNELAALVGEKNFKEQMMPSLLEKFGDKLLKSQSKKRGSASPSSGTPKRMRSIS